MNEFYSYSSKSVTAIVTIILSFVFSTHSNAQIEALATCDTITTDKTYAVEVTGLTASTDYNIVVEGVQNVFTTGDGTSADDTIFLSASINYQTGRDTTLVRVIEDPSGTPDTTDIIVHEALCIDIDGDGDMDFNEASCDYRNAGPDWGTIVATVAPYNGEQVYLYMLADTNGILSAIDSSSTGHFTGLENGSYKMYAYTFLTYGDALTFVDSLEVGDDLDDWTSGSDPICYNFCGDATYTIDCGDLIEIDVAPEDLIVCEGDDGDMSGYATVTVDEPLSMLPTPNDTSYQWLVNDGSGWTPLGGETDTLLEFTDIDFDLDSNLYQLVATISVNGNTIDSDTSDAALLTVYEGINMDDMLSATVCSGDSIGVILALDGTSTATADSFEIISITDGALVAGGDNASIGTYADSSVIENDVYTNTSSGVDSVIYEVVAMTGDGCISDTVDIVITVDPEPVYAGDLDNQVCSGDIAGITLPDSANIAFTYSIAADVGSGLSGTPTTGSSSDTLAIYDDVFTNNSGAVDTVVYTITPISADNCEGDAFEVILIVDPVPYVEDIAGIVCSDEMIDITLPMADSAGMMIDSFDIVIASVGSNLVPVDSTSGTGITLVDAIASDIYTNESGDTDSVVYTITPYVGECAGDDFSVTVTVTSEAVGTDSTYFYASDEMLDINLDDLITNGVTGVDFEWFAESNENVTGETTDTTNSGTITDVITNLSGSTQNVIYKVIPSLGDSSCIGDTIMVTVTICSEPVYRDSTLTVCSDEVLDFDLSSLRDSITVADGFTYTVASSDSTNVPPGAARTDTTATNITDTYENTTASSVIITYTITPHTNDGCSGDEFTVTITVDPEPFLADDLGDTVCSDSPIGLTLTLDENSVAADSFELISINDRGLTVISQTALGYITADSLANDVYENTGSSADSVTYQVAPISADGCIGDTINITITVDPEVTVDAGLDETICSTADVALGGSVSGGSATGTWSTDGDGKFYDSTDEMTRNEDGSYANAMVYVPGMGDRSGGDVTLTLTSGDPEGECGEESDSITITINSVECGTFPWTGNE